MVSTFRADCSTRTAVATHREALAMLLAMLEPAIQLPAPAVAAPTKAPTAAVCANPV